jgi:fatty acid desaturase
MCEEGVGPLAHESKERKKPSCSWSERGWRHHLALVLVSGIGIGSERGWLHCQVSVTLASDVGVGIQRWCYCLAMALALALMLALASGIGIVIVVIACCLVVVGVASRCW